MTLLLPPFKRNFGFYYNLIRQRLLFFTDYQLVKGINNYLPSKRIRYAVSAFIDLALIVIILLNASPQVKNIVSPLVSPLLPLHSLNQQKNTREIFGFAPFWNIDKLDNVDFKTLTTMAYFGAEVMEDGNLDKSLPGYQTFVSNKATKLFKKAHQNGTKVVLTITQMENSAIRNLMDDGEAQNRAIDQAVRAVADRGIDGLNIDLEYSGDPGDEYRQKFTNFVDRMTQKMHQTVPNSYVTVSVYASAVKDPKIYDIAQLSKVSDGIFMMAYDFAVAGSDNAIPTAPLYGHQSGKYWYDIASAVDDFLKFMPSEKLILGVPYYGYNYLVYEPAVKAETRPGYTWRGRPASQTYTTVQEEFNSTDIEGADEVIKGWDDDGKVGYTAYHLVAKDVWRIVFMEDEKSLGLKYDFAKEKNLAGVGMWALGNDEGRTELWALLAEKFGNKQLADNQLMQREVLDINE